MPTKSWIYSKTIWSSVVSMAAIGLYFAGYSVSQADQAQITGDILAALGIVANVAAIVGRIVATHRITK